MVCNITGVSVGAYKPTKQGEAVHGYRGDEFQCPRCGDLVVVFGAGSTGHPINVIDYEADE